MNDKQFRRLVEIDDILFNQTSILENERKNELKYQKLLAERALILKLHKEEQQS